MYTYDLKEKDEVMQFDNTMMENTFQCDASCTHWFKRRINQFPEPTVVNADW